MPEQKMYFIPSEKEITSSDQIGPGGGGGGVNPFGQHDRIKGVVGQF